MRTMLLARGSVQLVLLVTLGISTGAAASQFISDREIATKALTTGEYVVAERAARTWSDRVEQTNGAHSLEFAEALDLLVEALLQNGRGAEATTLAFADRALQIRESLAGRETPATTASLHRLGAVRAARGEFQRAAELHRRGLTIRRAAPGPPNSSVADSINYLAAVLIQLQEFGQARDLLRQAVTIAERPDSSSPDALARSLELLGTSFRYLGEYANATPPLERALELRRSIGWRHPKTASVLQERGWLWLLTGDIAMADRSWADSVAMLQATLRPDHPAIAGAQRLLAFAEFSLGDLQRARTLRQTALELGEVSLAPCDPERWSLLNGMATSLQYDGEYSGARKLFDRQLGLITQCTATRNGPAATDPYATTLYNQAELAALMGESRESEQLYRRAIDVWSEALGPSHPFVARALDSLAEVVGSRREYSRAQALYERALAIRVRTLGANHPHVAWTLTNISRNLADSGNARAALEQINRALEIYGRSSGADEPDHYARAFALRGTIEARLGRFQEAQASFREALTLRQRIFGPRHPLTAESEAQVAFGDFALGTYDRALDGALAAERVGREQLAFTVRYLPERQALAYAAKRPRGLDLALSIVASGHAGEVSSVFDALIKSRGVVLDELADRRRAGGETDPELRALTTSMNAARNRFAALMVRSMLEDGSVAQPLLDAARREKEDAEREVAERSAAVRAELARANVGVEAISRALPPRTALVSFLRYERSIFVEGQAGLTARRAPSYMAFVVRSDTSAVEAVPVGAAAEIDRLVDVWRRQVASGAAANAALDGYVQAGTTLRRRLWDPISKRLDGVSTVFIVPDGAINLVSFVALPVDSRRYLVEVGPILHYLSTERDLVRDAGRPPNGGLFAVGGPAFESTGPRPGVRRGEDCEAVGRPTFQDLPGSRAEVAEIARLWRTSDGGVTVLTGRQASETAVKRAASGHEVVHFATHGFFLRPGCQPQIAGSRAVGGIVVAGTRATDDEEDNALLRAGLALAGANRQPRAGGAEDGILTAEEIVALDLRGTRWAVLSACDTGVGEIRAGEGVFGLRRAFQIAGAETVIMSLWAVDDQAARVWMRGLYEARLTRHLSTAEAVHETTLRLLQDRRKRGESVHPFYWAGFVAAGEWR